MIFRNFPLIIKFKLFLMESNNDGSKLGSTSNSATRVSNVKDILK